MTFLTSRTAVLTYQDCPRRRYLAFLYNGHGISGSKQSLDTFIGTIAHRGLQNLLEHARVEHDGDTRLLHRECINQSVKVANKLFFDMLQESNGFYQKADDYTELEYKVDEAWALCEGLIRGFALWRLPLFGELYEVLEVEKEEEYWFEESQECSRCTGTGRRLRFIRDINMPSVENGSVDVCIDCNGSGKIGGILFQAKADGLLRGRQDNRLYVLSFKTARDFTELTMKQILHDMQGMSEIAAIENRLQKHYDFFRSSFIDESELDLNHVKAKLGTRMFDYFKSLHEGGLQELECYAVDYEYLLKGRYQQDPWNSGIYKWQSPLIHCWKDDGIVNMMSKTHTGIDYKWKAGKGRMPAGWEKINVWEDVGVEAWLDALLAHEIQPEEGDPFQNIFRSEVVIRDREHIEEWKVATAFQERQIARDLQTISELNPDNKARPYLLAQMFPKHTNRCHDFYGNDCPFVEICHEGFSVEELIEDGKFKARTPHHATELEEFKKKGILE